MFFGRNRLWRRHGFRRVLHGTTIGEEMIPSAMKRIAPLLVGCGAVRLGSCRRDDPERIATY